MTQRTVSSFFRSVLFGSAALLGLLVGPTATASDKAPVVVAVDTSRSLSPAALGEVVDRLRLTLEAIDEDTPTALLAFDDQPRWVVPLGASPREVAEKLPELRPQGNFTLLNDALFVATRELEHGGVLLLATDGRDENSAVEVDDIARRCEAQGIRILSVGTGRNIEEKALRRLALLSDGDYLGPVGNVDASDVAEGVESARAQISASVASARRAARTAPTEDRQTRPIGSESPAETPTQPAQPTPRDQPAAGAPAAGAPAGTSESQPWWMSPAVWALAALALVLAFVLLRRRSSPVEDEQEFDVDEQQASDEAEAGLIRLELAQADIAQEEEAPEVTVDTAVFQRMTLDERLDRTRVLSNHSVLIMRKMGEQPRTFMLDRQKAFGVGRDRLKNTLAAPDPALSSQHFKIVPRDDLYFLVDMESTNGSYVNGRRVNAKRLRHGDVIRAGQVEFEYQNYSNI